MCDVPSVLPTASCGVHLDGFICPSAVLELSNINCLHFKYTYNNLAEGQKNRYRNIASHKK